jgi:hypothetical protein
LGEAGDPAAQLTATVMSDIASINFTILIANAIFIVLPPHTYNGLSILLASKGSRNHIHNRQRSAHSGRSTR